MSRVGVSCSRRIRIRGRSRSLGSCSSTRSYSSPLFCSSPLTHRPTVSRFGTIAPPSDFFDFEDLEPTKAFASKADRTSEKGILRFKTLRHYVKMKKRVESSNSRQTIEANGYEVVRFLGKGRFGNVFLSREVGGDYCAIKILNVERARREYSWTWLTVEEREQASSDRASFVDFVEGLESGFVKDQLLRANFLIGEKLEKEANPLERKIRRPVAEREILLRCGTGSPFVSSLRGSFRDSSRMYLVFDYYTGGTLYGLMKRSSSGFLTPEVARFYSAQLLLALEYLGKVNIAHRDVKPSNLLLDAESNLVVCDFGLATRLRGGLKTFCGTAEYIAPEVLQEQTWSSRYLDLWAFGVCVYAMLSGKTPFEGKNAQEVFLNTLTSPLVFPDDFDDDAKDLLTKVLSRDYSKRPSIDEIKNHDFFKSIDFEAVENKSIKPPGRRRKGPGERVGGSAFVGRGRVVWRCRVTRGDRS